MRLRTLVGLGALLAPLTANATALAQQANRQPPPATPTTVPASSTPQSAPVHTADAPSDEDVVITHCQSHPTGAPAPTASTMVTAAPVRAPMEPARVGGAAVMAAPRRPFARFRFGFDGTGGAWVRGPEAAYGGLRARLGVQLGDYFSVYYMPTGLIGSFYNHRGTSDNATGVFYNTGMLELTLFDMLQVGAGPSVDFIWGCDDNVQSRLSCNDHGPYFGLDGRLAVVIAPTLGESRMGLTLSADVHGTWYASETAGITVLGGIGLDMF